MPIRECREFVQAANLYLTRKGEQGGTFQVRLGIRRRVILDEPDPEPINLLRIL